MFAKQTAVSLANCMLGRIVVDNARLLRNVIFNPVGIKASDLTPDERYIYMPKRRKILLAVACVAIVTLPAWVENIVA